MFPLTIFLTSVIKHHPFLHQIKSPEGKILIENIPKKSKLLDFVLVFEPCSSRSALGGWPKLGTSAFGVQAFDFDRVFGPEVQQAGIFHDVSQLVTSALDGYNVCIFAYGQTGENCYCCCIGTSPQ